MEKQILIFSTKFILKNTQKLTIQRNNKIKIQSVIIWFCDIQFCHMKNPSQLLPLKLGSLDIRPITWQDFKGEVDSTMPWSAHIYWNIDYKITDPERKKLTAKLHMSKRSWVREQKKSDHLLNHEQGHYLIGSLCVLEFLRRVDAKKENSQEKFEDLVQKTFDRTIKEFVELEKKYDIQTEHRLNYKKQEQWDKLIYERICYYQLIYDSRKKKFVKYSESPTKNKRKL